MSPTVRHTLLLAGAALLTSCASLHLHKGDKAFDLMQYRKASEHYDRALRSSPDRRAQLRLAEAHYHRNDPHRAREFYALADATQRLSGDTALRYGQVLLSSGATDAAGALFLRVLEETPEDRRAQDLFASTRDVALFHTDSGRYIVNRLTLPGLTTAFSPRPHGKGLLVVGERPAPAAKADPWDGLSYMDLYTVNKRTVVTWTEAVPLPGAVNGPYHEGPAVVSPDGRTLFFTRSDYLKRKLMKDAANTSHLMLFRATLDSTGQWSDLIDFPYNSPDWSTGHPALSADGRTMYFVSDRPGGLGGSDIWMSEDRGAGWTAPVNLGPTVNTPGNELFPVVNGRSLYFSSTAHRNMGGLDVFETHPENDGWSTPRNLNAPLNTPFDDFGLVLDSTEQGGYLSSNREGSDQVYVFWAYEPTFFVEGEVVGDSGLFLPNVHVTLTDLTLNEDVTVITGPNGAFSFPLKANTDYRIKAGHADHLTRTIDLSTKGLLRSDTLHHGIQLQGAQVGQSFVLNNIYYDYDKWDIRLDAAKELDRVVQLINDNPHLSFELSAHTDARGSVPYNLVLSDARANSAVNYLIRRGADPARIQAMGYGEERLVNDCRDGVKCNEEEHQANRRTEFKVVKADQASIGR